ncbi:hypothetical protein [Mixta calida]|uniref:hypothetical protein n=1 Tax=Mixta calida TaxID=665913 RepID=UPI0034D39706
MHYGQEYIKKHILNKVNNVKLIPSVTIGNQMASDLSSALHHDALNYLYSALISYGEALNGIAKGFYSWSTVKLYYSSFYALRSILALDNVCIFYMDSKPYTLFARTGENPAKAAGTTHKVVMAVFSKNYPSSPFVTQEIDFVPCFDWIMGEREAANYKNGKFIEPSAPNIYIKCKESLQVNLNHYLKDNNYLYCFDKDHAMLSLPIEILKVAKNNLLSKSSYRFSASDAKYLKQVLQLSNKPVRAFYEYIDSIK